MKPLKLAMYYGYVNSINGYNNISDIIDELKKYDVVILDNYQEPNLSNIVSSLLTHYTFIIGRVDMTLSKSDIKDVIDIWNNYGAYGMYLDNCGYDCHVGRHKQNNILDYVHDKSMIAFINTKYPADIFWDYINMKYNPFGYDPHIQPGDWYVYEGYQVSNGEYENPSEWKNKSEELVKFKDMYNVNIACIATNNNSIYDDEKAKYSYLSSILYNFDAWGFVEYMYSENNYMPYRERIYVPGSEFTTDIIEDNGICKRRLNVGIKIDSNIHSADILL